MKPIDQTILQSEEENGNCLAAAIASILEMQIEDVPEFQTMDGEWFTNLQGWLKGLGLYLLEWRTEVDYIPGYYLVGGKSPRGDFGHEVVYHKGAMVHDPHPSRAGLDSFIDMWVIVPMDPSRIRRGN